MRAAARVNPLLFIIVLVVIGFFIVGYGIAQSLEARLSSRTGNISGSLTIQFLDRDGNPVSVPTQSILPLQFLYKGREVEYLTGRFSAEIDYYGTYYSYELRIYCRVTPYVMGRQADSPWTVTLVSEGQSFVHEKAIEKAFSKKLSEIIPDPEKYVKTAQDGSKVPPEFSLEIWGELTVTLADNNQQDTGKTQVITVWIQWQDPYIVIKQVSIADVVPSQDTP